MQGEGDGPTAQDLRRAHKPRRVWRMVKRVLFWAASTLTAMPIVVDPNTPIAFAVVSNQSGPPYDVSDSNVRLEPGETLSILLQTIASNAVCVTNLSWMER